MFLVLMEVQVTTKNTTLSHMFNLENICWNKWLDDLEKNISNYEKIFLDTETTSLKVQEADLVWVSIYLDDKNIYYINVLHNWENVTKKDLISFLENIFNSDKLIVGHNLKYDLEIIKYFKKSLQL